MIAAAAALALAQVAATAVPPAFHGEWQAAKRQCGGDQENMLKVSRNTLSFYEARFAPRRVQRPDHRTLSMRGLWQEGGQDTPATLHLSLSADSNRLTVRSPWWSTKLVRC